MKKYTVRTIVAITMLLILASAGIASADNGGVHLIPYRDGPTFYASEGDYIYIRAGWAACTYGLTQAFTRHANVILESDGTTLVSSRKQAQGYWEKPFAYEGGNVGLCVPSTDLLYRSWWDYPLGYLDAGEYNFHFVYSLDRPFPDGGDYDGDGSPDLLPLNIEVDFTIVVE